MRVSTVSHVMGCLLVAAVLQGCAGTAQVLSAADQQSLKSLPLFARDGTPRFSLELSCSGEFISCNTIRHGFEHWTDDRHIPMQMVGVEAAPSVDCHMPYRLVVSISPLVISTYDKVDFKYDEYTHKPTPKVGYRANLKVFHSAQELRNFSIHDERIADYKADANITLRAELKTLIAGMDPTYRSH